MCVFMYFLSLRGCACVFTCTAYINVPLLYINKLMKKGTDNCCVDGYLSDKKIYRITEIQNIATQEQVKLDFGELQLTAKEHESTFDE